MRLFRSLAAAAAPLLMLAASPAAAAPPPAFEAKVAATEAALMADPSAALRLAREAGAMAAAITDPRDAGIAAATASWLEAEALIGLNRIDAATAPAEASARRIATVAPRSKLAGDVERTLATIAGAQGAAPLTSVAKFDHQVTGVAVTADGRRFVNFPRRKAARARSCCSTSGRSIGTRATSTGCCITSDRPRS